MVNLLYLLSSRTIKVCRRKHTLAFIVCLILLYLLYISNDTIKALNEKYFQASSNSQSNVSNKNIFRDIYQNELWGSEGDGSGPGSGVEYTKEARNILYSVIEKYNISSMIDAPCGSFIWMKMLIQNVTHKNHDFKYHGVDIVESVVNKSSRIFNDKPNLKFTVLDFTSKSLPNDYDLIFSRDSLQHLSFSKVINALENFAYAKNAKYLLVGSYLNSPRYTNLNVKDGSYFLIDLTRHPFKLRNYIEIFKEKQEINDKVSKHLILYDIKNYLKHIDFTAMRKRASAL